MNEQAGEIKKPGMVQAIAIMNLVDGILNCLWGLGLFFCCNLAFLSCSIRSWWQLLATPFSMTMP